VESEQGARRGASDSPTNPETSGARYRLVAGRTLLFDNEGFLWHPSDWDEEVAVELAGELGLAEMDQRQWEVVRFLRTYYAENGRSPLNRPLARGVGMSLLELEGLFPQGIKYGARRVAGLPNPKNCT